MQTKYKVGIVAVALAGSFALGRYTTPERVKIETKIVEVEKKVKDTDVKKKRKKTKVVITKPDGSKEEHTTTETDTEKKEKETTDTTTNTDTKKDVAIGDNSLTTISLMGAMDLRTSSPVYGIQAYRSILGPFGIGVFGLTNSTVGLNIGVSF